MVGEVGTMRWAEGSMGGKRQTAERSRLRGRMLPKGLMRQPAGPRLLLLRIWNTRKPGKA